MRESRLFIILLALVLLPLESLSINPKCKFQLFNNSLSSKLLFWQTADGNIPQRPSIVWSRINKKIENYPDYAKLGVAMMENARISLMSGAVFDSNGCVSAHIIEEKYFHSRLRFMESLTLDKLSKETVKLLGSSEYAFEEVIYFGGSIFSNDLQHAIIDFLPLYNFALPFILRRPSTVKIIAGTYSKFFESIFPFNMSSFIPKDYRYKNHWQHPIAPLFFAKKLLYVDFIDRDQSFTLPGAYNRVIEWLKSPPLQIAHVANQQGQQQQQRLWIDSIKRQDQDLDVVKYKSSLRDATVVPAKLQLKLSPSSQVPQNAVVYLDRSLLNNDPAYVKSAGKANGRSVVNQDYLLSQIRQSLKSSYELVVWACKDWQQDRNVMARAKVIMGPHGGHFVNMIFAPATGTHIVEFGRSYSLRQLRNYTAGYRNARWVFAGMSSSLGHTHWFIEDVDVVNNYLKNKIKPKWSDGDITVDCKQVIDTLVKIGVSTKSERTCK